MRRPTVVLLAGVCIIVAGLAVFLNADSLATTWPLTEGGSGRAGLTDPSLRRTYSALGAAVACFGQVLVAGAAVAWMVAADERPQGLLIGT